MTEAEKEAREALAVDDHKPADRGIARERPVNGPRTPEKPSQASG